MRYVLIFIMFAFCQNKSNSNLGEEWIKNFKSKGGELFYDIDYYKFGGDKPFKQVTFNNNSIIYGVIKSSKKVSIFTINCKNKSINVVNKYLYKNDNCFVSTEIIPEMNLNSHNRIISIYKDNVIIEFDYIVSNQYEFLNEIIFKYKTGEIKKYINKKKSFLNYNLNISEDSDLLKDMIKE